MSPVLTWVRTLGVEDPSPAAQQLDALNSTALLGRSADQARLAQALSGCASTIEGAGGQAAAAWTAPAPSVGLRSLARAVDDTASVLQRQGAAMAGAAALLDRAKSNARLDWTLAAAEIDSLGHTEWPDVLGGALGLPAAGTAVRIRSILADLNQALRTRLAEADAALDGLRSALGADANEPADRLHVGPGALVPPDPISGPAGRTDRHNRELLADDLRSGDPARVAFAIAITHSLQLAADRGGHAELVVYDSTAYDGQGRAAIAVGDLSTATNVAVVVPGIGNSPSDMNGGVTVAANLRDEAQRQSPGETTAVVAWYGYDIPLSAGKDPSETLGTRIADTMAAASAVNAEKGAPVLATDLAAIKNMASGSVRTTLVGFSMGSTTVSAAAHYQLPVDSIILLGSPGAGWGTSSASTYRNVPASSVWTLSYDQDPVTLPITDDLVARHLHLPDAFGPDPAADTFGGNHIAATTNVPVVAGRGLIPSLARVVGDPRHHSIVNYTQGSALAAEGAIIVGRPDRVPKKPGRPAR